MYSYKKNSLATFLSKCTSLIENSISYTTIANAVSLFGYDSAKLNAGKLLLDQALNETANQQSQYGEQYGSTDTKYQLKNDTHKTYMKTVKVARIVFDGDTDAIGELQLKKGRDAAFADWYQQAFNFYTNLLAKTEFTDAMAEYAFTRLKLETEFDDLKHVEEANLAFLEEKGEAQQSTKDRNAILDQLQEWSNDYSEIAKIALKAKPQLLEVLGIFVKS